MAQLDRLFIGDAEYVSYFAAVRTVEGLNAEIADLKSANKLLHSLIASRDHDIGQLYEAMGKDRAEIEQLRTALLRIDGINDNPSHYNAEINAVVWKALRDEQTGDGK